MMGCPVYVALLGSYVIDTSRTQWFPNGVLYPHYVHVEAHGNKMPASLMVSCIATLLSFLSFIHLHVW